MFAVLLESIQSITGQLLLVYADAVPRRDFVKLVSVSLPSLQLPGVSSRTTSQHVRLMALIWREKLEASRGASCLEAAVQLKACNLLSTGEL